MSKNCGIIKDLLPLYADDVCTEESRRMVTEHIAECSECRAELEKMGRNISVASETDIKVMKRIKKRMRIEKITVGVISLLAVLGIAVSAMLYGLNTLTPMDTDKIAFGSDLRAEVDEDGNLWLIMKNYPATEEYIMPTISDKNGKHFGVDNDFDSSAKEGIGVIFMQKKIDSLSFFKSYDEKERRIEYTNVDERGLDKAFYYDEKTNTEYVLWERENND